MDFVWMGFVLRMYYDCVGSCGCPTMDLTNVDVLFTKIIGKVTVDFLNLLMGWEIEKLPKWRLSDLLKGVCTTEHVSDEH